MPRTPSRIISLGQVRSRPVGLLAPWKSITLLIFGRFLEERFVEIDVFLGFMVEEVDLGAGHAQVVQSLEELFPRLGRANWLLCLQNNTPHALLLGVLDELLDLIVGPAVGKCPRGCGTWRRSGRPCGRSSSCCRSVFGPPPST